MHILPQHQDKIATKSAGTFELRFCSTESRLVLSKKLNPPDGRVARDVTTI
jgi:hypothetical protein